MTAKRRYGTGRLSEKHGAYDGRWRTSDGRCLNRRVGPTRAEGSKEGLTRSQAERAFRKLQDDEERAWVRAEHSSDGKSDLSTRRSVPMRIGSRRSSTAGRSAARTSVTATSSSPTPSPADRSIAAR